MDTRQCAQCGALFAPRREHARFCSASCRVAWNCELGESQSTSEGGVLDWSFTAMLDITGRLLRARVLDQPPGYALITEAVWWCTMVDATLVRYHPDTYTAALADCGAAERQVIEDTFAGLRFVRNQLGYKTDHDAFIQPTDGHPVPAGDRVAAWTWKPVSQPSLSSLSPRGQDWEMTRYRAYQAQLAGCRIGDSFSRAADFLRQVSKPSPSHSPR